MHLLSAHRHHSLCDGLTMLNKQIFHATPGDAYVFSVNNSAEVFVSSTCPEAMMGGFMNFEKLESGWLTPAEASNSSAWHLKGFSEEYRRMGHWRLTFPIGFARSLGYKWALQIDTDSIVGERLEQNLVAELESRDAYLAARTTIIDVPTWGLPELTRYFIVTEQLVPQTLFSHCKPPSIDGLYTVGSEEFPGDLEGEPSTSLKETGGWNRSVLYGNFLAINTDFWFREDIQAYLALIVGTGGHFRFRWNEQAVVGMLSQLFVPASRLHFFTFEYSHQGYHFHKGEMQSRKSRRV